MASRLTMDTELFIYVTKGMVTLILYSEDAPYNYIENLTDFVEKIIRVNKAA